MNISFQDQRQTYKLLEKLASKEFESEISLLTSLVSDIVDLKEFEITGGRVWELLPSENSYILRYQYGNVKKIPDDYKVSIVDEPVFSQLAKKRTLLNKEKDEVLRETGIELYSVTGVGDKIKLQSGTYYQYAIGFNADAILQSFFETLSIISSVASVAIRHLSSQLIQKKISQDLIQASEIQRNLLPDHYLEFLDYKIFGVCSPANEVGGDYFDYIRYTGTEDERLGILISDAASKGLPAAIQALFVSGAIRMAASFAARISSLFTRLNTLIWDTFLIDRFVTMFFCELTHSSNRLVLYANAGHCSPIRYRPSTDSFKDLTPTGGMLGLLQNQKFNVENIRMKPGDVLLLYTDGLSEASDKNGKLFGEARLAELLKLYHKDSPKLIAYHILEEVQKFSAEGDYNDDKTIVIIKRDEESIVSVDTKI